MTDTNFTIKSAVADHVSVAFHQNAIPVIHEIALNNPCETDVADVELSVISEPAFAAPLIIRIERVGAGATHHVRALGLQLDAAFLRKINEGVRGGLAIRAVAGELPLAEESLPIQLYPPSHWGGSGAAPELLAAFVRPNDPAVDAILRDAASKLSAAGKHNAIDGYESGSRQRAWELAGAIWAAIASRSIAYVLPPASFERSGQKVRSPSDILERQLATCLDSALLFAACLEQAHLNPVLVLTNGHAFVGLWLKDDGLPTAIVDDMQMLRKRRDLEDMIFVETTLLTHTPPARFKQAVEHAANLVDEDAPDALEFALDVQRARSLGIRPLELGDGSAAIRPFDDGRPVDLEIEDAPPFLGEVAAKEESEGPVDRLERWKRKLLDLSLRNKLLNFKDTKKGLSIECPDPARLEDLLSSGSKFRLLPRADVLGAEDPRDAALFREQRHEDGRRRFLLEALERSELHTNLTESELDARLTELFRLVRTAFEEGGSNVLFLALGFLTWTQKDGSKLSRAPLILIPVSLHRASVRSGFRLAAHEEDARVNPTLLQMLRQDYKLNIPEFDKDLPTDASGLDVSRIWQIIRTHIRDLKGWEVTPDVVLSTFSFTKFLMWRDLVDRMEILKRNPVVRHLIDTPKHSYGDHSTFPDPHGIDRNHHPADLFAPLLADSSQLAAVLAAADGKDFVLFGPPGAGKSQTIANMISQCLALGKSVLFVSQKTAALEVVQRRLNEVGLGEYCLEIHSTKAQKSVVLSQLKTAWHERSAPAADDWEPTTSELAKLRDELNTLVSALHRRRKNGMTAHQAFARVVAAQGLFNDVTFEWGAVEHTPEQLAAFRDLIREACVDLREVGSPAKHPLQGIVATEWSASWRSELEDAAASFINAARNLDGKAKAFAETVGLDIKETRTEMDILRRLGRLLNHKAAPMGSRFLAPDGAAMVEGLAKLGELQEQAARLRKDLKSAYRPSVFREDLRQLLSEWRSAGEASFLVRGGKLKQVRKKLQPFATSPLSDDIGPDLVILIEMRKFADAADAISHRLAAFENAAGLDTELKAFLPWAEWANDASRLSEELASLLGMETDVIRQHIMLLLGEYVHLFGTEGSARRAHERLSEAIDRMETAQKRLMSLAGRGDSGAPLAHGPSWIKDSIAIAESWKANLHLAPSWLHWNGAASRLRAAGLGPLTDAIERGLLYAGDAGAAFEAAYARWWANRLMTDDAVLRSFTAARQEDAIARFRAADERVTELTKRVVRGRLSGGIPSPTAFGADPEWGTLARELAKRSRHQPLRQLFANIRTILPKLTPCLLMSPLSIAQYLPPDSEPFDIVIFDEASQIPVWDAIGAIARGKQVVIVGDPEQLPPTSVGERGVDDIEDGIDVEDQESILDECLASNIPSLRLDWHYRSRHESLIAFSNNHYYGGRLVTFPSPVTDDRSVRYVNVPNGVYERGSGRVNREEACAVVAEIVRRLKDPEFTLLRSSLGVVTFNGEQQRLIESLLDHERRSHPDLEVFFDSARWREPVFVKNLENVQGDERDVILFSVAVAPDNTGRPVATISSLNKNGGHRRLNVAITRARHEMVVFATLRPEQIDLSRTNARGVRDFKHFLEFAERGTRAIAEAFAARGDGPESPFEEAVKAALEKRGWVVHTQIGVSAFRVDLGVVDPDAPGRYVAGVECDGATYHRSATARDRDRLREHILTQLGWRIRRVWSADWWHDSEGACEKLHQQLLADVEASRTTRARIESAGAIPSAPPSEPEIEEEHDTANAVVGLAEKQTPNTVKPVRVAEIPSDQPVLSPAEEPTRIYAGAAPMAPNEQAPANSQVAIYRLADLGAVGFDVEPERFYDALYRSQLRRMVADVIAIEGPIYEDLLIERIKRAHGFNRAGDRIREIVLAAVSSRIPRTKDGDRVVYWPEGADPAARAAFRRSPDGARDHADIPLPELASLATTFLGDGADREEVVRKMALYFKLGRLRESARARFEEAARIAESL
jgi:very-short-patch-repair endonuclease